MRRKGFSLIELLVVVGIVGVIVGLLLPSLSRARESARQVACAANLRQLGLAFTSYAQRYDGQFPLAAGGPENPSDWIWWQSDRIQNLGQSAIAPYVGPTNLPPACRCPSDDLSTHSVGAAGPYPFSYSLNWLLTPNSGGWGVLRATAVKHPSDKVMIYEEDERTINDGWGYIGHFDGTNWNYGSDMLAIRHDHHRRLPDTWPGYQGPEPNPDCRGNAAFVDGHVEFYPRGLVHTREHADPRY